jgi:hypothetical protein
MMRVNRSCEMTASMIRAALRQLLACSALLALAGTPAHSQQITGVPGSPSATVTIDGKQLPPPIRNSAG